MKWHFKPRLPYFVETGVTQRDQFRNDELDLSDAIVREAVQNSLDASLNGKQTRVSFRWLNGDSNLDSQYFGKLFEGQLDHAKFSGLEIDDINFESPSALIIEDFGTHGLTGSTDEWDEDNFSDFWRRHGRSHKSGKSRGRWGLGKLVYSSSSMLSAFFGVTVRQGDSVRHLMGQTVLDLHKYQGKDYPAHAFYSDMAGSTPEEETPIPINDQAFTDEFCDRFRLVREQTPGLSIVIPFPNPDLKPDTMIGVAIFNYFYPIITNQLILDFDGQEITSANIRELAHRHNKSKISDIDQLFDFIEQAHEMPEKDLLVLKDSWLDDTRLDENDFDPDDLSTIRERFAQGEMVGVRLPLEIKKKSDKSVIKTGFSVFVQRPHELSKGQDLYVRGGLTLPGEAKFGERKAFGTMIAEEEAISSFLGDAENPAHTKWIYRAEKLRKNYVAPEKKLRVIRNSVVNFYDLLVQAVEEEDEKALVNFFWADLPEAPGPASDKGTTPPTPDLTIVRKPKLLRLETIEDGFSVRGGPDADLDSFPIQCRIKVAYDIATGNPFRKYDPLDFDFTSKDSPHIAVTKKSVTLLQRKPNELVFEISDPKCQINVTGFDPNRDLQIKLRTLETAEV